MLYERWRLVVAAWKMKLYVILYVFIRLDVGDTTAQLQISL
jgi:hypothetical protein